uniref:Uncharacterized protein n=1 Tax=Myoviridae sp. ctCo31 TaxID=2825053 RepID=A0A8S5UM73_9CAUD|nr:MAG TPA: hypothetical protein [Myoviridae sp. ctCo31]
MSISVQMGQKLMAPRISVMLILYLMLRCFY